MQFVNDPSFGDVPAVGEGEVLLARRVECGSAARWAPNGDAVALAEWLGPNFRALDGVVYRATEGGTLVPVDWLAQEVVLVRPPAGEIHVVSKHVLAAEYAQVVGEADVVKPKPVKRAAKKAVES